MLPQCSPKVAVDIKFRFSLAPTWRAVLMANLMVLDYWILYETFAQPTERETFKRSLSIKLL